MPDLKRAELAEELRVSERTLRRVLARGVPGIRSYRIGRTTFYRPECVEAIKGALAIPEPFMAARHRSVSVVRRSPSASSARDAILELTRLQSRKGRSPGTALDEVIAAARLPAPKRRAPGKTARDN